MTDTDALIRRIAVAAATSEGFGPDRPDHEDVVGEYMSDAMFLAPAIAEEVRAAKAEAWQEYAAALEAVPDYAPTEYDRGRVDQRHATIEELHARAARRDEEKR